MLSDEITDLELGIDGTVWIGTPKGINYYFDTTISRLYGLPAENVTTLLADGANNLWVGTRDGMCIFYSNTFSWSPLYTTENSGIVHDHVTSLSMDYVNGDLYICTNGGLSILKTPFAMPSEKPGELYIYPNPFNPARDVKISIDNLARDMSVSIFSSDGFLIRKYTSNQIYGKRFQWDGRNASGSAVSSGIYFIVAVNENSVIQTGKFALIR